MGKLAVAAGRSLAPGPRERLVHMDLWIPVPPQRGGTR